jgi:hypothetical protein
MFATLFNRRQKTKLSFEDTHSSGMFADLDLSAVQSAQAVEQHVASSGQKIWRQVVKVHNSMGREEAFAMAQDGLIWNLQPDVVSELGYRPVSMGIRAETLAAAQAPDGRIFVFASRGKALYVRMENNAVDALNQGRWAPPLRADLPTDATALRVQSLVTETIEGTLCVGIVTHDNADVVGTAMMIQISVWNAYGPVKEALDTFQDSSFDDCLGLGDGVDVLMR